MNNSFTHLIESFFTNMTLLLILIGVVCGCYVLLFIIVSYLCLVVRQIRQDLTDFSKDANIYFERANSDDKYEEKRKQLNSKEPLVSSQQHSEVYPNPCEPVRYRKQVITKHQENSAFSNAQTLESAHCAVNDEDARMNQTPNRSENSYPETAIDSDKSDGKRNRLSSMLHRNRPKQSEPALQPHPCELVSYIKREERRECPTPNIEDVRIDRAPKFIPLKCARNDGFEEDDLQGPSRNSTWPAIPEPSAFKPGRRKMELGGRDRCCTMDISQI